MKGYYKINLTQNIFNMKLFDPTKLLLKMEQKTTNLPVKTFVCAGVSSFLLAKALKKTRHPKMGSFVATLALPLLAFGAYKKISNTELSKK